MGIGSGVVYDSEGSKEYDECLLKMKFLTDPPKRFELIETMLHEPGKGIWLRDRHMRAARRFGHYFRFAFDSTAILSALERRARRARHRALAGAPAARREGRGQRSRCRRSRRKPPMR